METAENRGEMTQSEQGTAGLTGHGLAGLLAASSMLASIGATSCCVIPFALFGLGITGAWMGELTALAPFQPVFVAIALACLAGGGIAIHRARKAEACAGGYCARPAARRITKIGLLVSSVIVFVAVTWPILLPLMVSRPVVAQ